MVKIRYISNGKYWRKTFDTVDKYEEWRKAMGSIEIVEYEENE